MQVQASNWEYHKPWYVLLNGENKYDILGAYQATPSGVYICTVGENNYSAASEEHAKYLIYLSLQQRGYSLEGTPTAMSKIPTLKAQPPKPKILGKPTRFEREDIC